MARKFVPGFATRAKHLIALTGTPVLNRPIEIHGILQALQPENFSDFFGFAKRYCGAYNNGYGWDFSGCTNSAELRQKLNTVMVRREKAQVLPDLPNKRRVTINVELSNRREYSDALETENDALVEAVRNKNGGDALVILNRLRRLAGKGKIEAAKEWIENFLAGGGQLIVFAHHKDILDELETALRDNTVACVRVDGDVAVAKRQAAVDAFQSGQVRVFLGTPGAAGVGLTLTAASDVLFVEREWTPAVEEQAEDRAHRIGQDESVTAWYLTASDSIDDKFATLVDAKRRVIAAVLDGKEIDNDESLVMELARDMIG